MKDFLVFRVRDCEPQILRMYQTECRGDNSLKLLQRLIALDPARFNDRTGVINYEDGPPALRMEWAECDLHFCSTKVQGLPSTYLPFPCCHALSWPAIGLEDGDALVHAFLANEEPPVHDLAFWLGADTHVSRRALVELAAQHSTCFRCNFITWDRANPQRLTADNYVSLWDHRLYKYLVDCPGYGYSGRLKWLLATGRPVFVVDRPFVEQWHDDLQPWVHYVPVKSDLSDLLNAHARIEADAGLYASIGWHAKQFARERLLLDRQLENALQAVPLAGAPLKIRRIVSGACVTQSEKGYDKSVCYDLNICLPVCCEGKYRRRLEAFKRCGLFNLEGRRVHLTLIGGERDWLERDFIADGWPAGCAVTLLAVNCDRPLAKINAFYLWQQHCKLRARWHLRVDDDSMTDVAEMLRYVDRNYQNTAVHVMTSPYLHRRGPQVFLAYFLLRDIPLPLVAHEHESSITSDAALQRVFANPQAMDFLQYCLIHEHQPGDQALALAMLASNVPVAVNPVATKDFALDKLSLTGGPFYHIHYVDWEDPHFAALADALLHGTRRTTKELDVASLLSKPLPFGRGIGKVITELTLRPTGRIEGSTSENEARWVRTDDALQLQQPNGTVTIIFNTWLQHGPNAWLVGPHLFDSTTHFLRLS